MADDELRALARAVEARPGDVDARAAYARALGRRGDARGEHAQLALLARDGDPAARARLAAWVPWCPSADPGGLRRRSGRARAPRAPAPARAVALAAASHVAAVGRGHVVVDEAGALQVLDLATLRTCWRADDEAAPGALAIVGEALVTAARGELRSRDLATGEELARATLPDDVRRLVPLDDGRAIVVYGLTVAALELAPDGFGERAWERPVDHRHDLVVGGPYVGVRSPGGGCELLLAASGAPLWPRPARSLDGVAAPRLAAVDDGLLVVLDDRTGSLAAFDPEARRLRWRVADPGGGGGEPLLVVDDGLVLVARWGRDEGGSLVALDGATGAPRWRVAGPILPGPLPAQGVVYAQAAPGRLSCLELGSGAERWSVPLGPDPRRTVVAPCHDGLVMLGGDTLTVHTEPSS